MPIQLAVYGSREKKPDLKTIQLDKKANAFILQSDEAPQNVVLDPNTWVLMEATFVRK
jgi:aminopeptidase N